ncbi:MAG TPA: pyridoxine 5'-phosphate synthase [Alphaproteobacteria bacterium]|nr:pyridoxine 5'-phosphate synthase [Alphaproteobacteria bacterium]
MAEKVKLGVNIDHIATLRNARGEYHPSVLRAAEICKKAGADGITIHLREDRRHIRDKDLIELKKWNKLPINLELAATDEMLKIALKVKPNAVCIVPEKRQEITTEGGLDVAKNFKNINKITKELKTKNILVSLFVNPDIKQLDAAKKAGADIVEFHTGKYCNSKGVKRKAELKNIKKACAHAAKIGIIAHAGHGLNYETIPDIVKIQNIEELNIGHFIIGEAVFEGLENVIKKIRKVMKV